MSLSRSEDLHGIVFWIMGSLEEPNWVLVKVAAIGAVIFLIVSYRFCLDLNAFSLGEEEALHLGIDIERTKRLLFIIASFLTGFSVSVAGIIGFVGLVVPHFVRMLVGRDHRILLVSSFLVGAAFLIFCDTLARTIISPLELPVGVITGILGGSLFVYALAKRQVISGVK
jgi:iron complex transport system permease protein